MPAKKLLLLFINISGGIAVLGSYAQGVLTHPGAGQILWGGLPLGIRPFYTASMFLATAGYFAFTYLILFRLHPNDTLVANRFGFGVFNLLYAAILIPSALWMPFTFLAVEGSSQALLWVVRMVLAAVAAASLGLLFALIKVNPRPTRWAYRMAIVGSLFFCFQTVVLDAILWVLFFRL